MVSKSDIAKARQEAAEVVRVSDGNQRAISCIQNLVDIVVDLEKELHSSQNKSDFSGDMRVLKSRLEASKSEVMQYEKFRTNIMTVVTDAIRQVGASAGAILQTPEDAVLVKTNAQKILGHMKEIVEKLSGVQKAG